MPSPSPCSPVWVVSSSFCYPFVWFLSIRQKRGENFSVFPECKSLPQWLQVTKNMLILFFPYQFWATMGEGSNPGCILRTILKPSLSHHGGFMAICNMSIVWHLYQSEISITRLLRQDWSAPRETLAPVSSRSNWKKNIRVAFSMETESSTFKSEHLLQYMKTKRWGYQCGWQVQCL